MANSKTRGPDKAQTNTDNIVVKKQEDTTNIVRNPPVFTEDSKYSKNVFLLNVYGIFYLCFCSLDRYLCIASGRHVGIYSVESGDKVHSLKQHSVDVIGLAIKDKNVLYSCDASGEVIEWNISTGNMLKVYF